MLPILAQIQPEGRFCKPDGRFLQDSSGFPHKIEYTIFPLGNIKILNGCEVRIENSVTRVTVCHHDACRVMPISYPE